MAQATEPDHAQAEPVSFEPERFELSSEGRLELSGRWYGVRGLRFVRPTLTLIGARQRTRLLADLAHKPWAARDGEPWLAAFPLDARPSDPVTEIELAVSTDIAVALDPPDELAAGDPSSGRRSPGSRAVAASKAPPEEAQALRSQLSSAREQVGAAHTERRAALGRRDAAVQKADALLEELEAAKSAREAARTERGTMEGARDEAMRERELAHQERDEAQRERELALRERDQAQRERDEAQQERQNAQRGWREAHEGWREAVRERDRARAERDTAQAERDTALAERDEAVLARDGLSELRALTETEARVIARPDSPLGLAPPPPAPRRVAVPPALRQGLHPHPGEGSPNWVLRAAALVVLIVAIVVLVIIVQSA